MTRNLLLGACIFLFATPMLNDQANADEYRHICQMANRIENKAAALVNETNSLSRYPSLSPSSFRHIGHAQVGSAHPRCRPRRWQPGAFASRSQRPWMQPFIILDGVIAPDRARRPKLSRSNPRQHAARAPAVGRHRRLYPSHARRCGSSPTRGTVSPKRGAILVRPPIWQHVHELPVQRTLQQLRPG